MSWSKFRQQMTDSFDYEELRTLCFDLGVDYDSLRGEGKAAKIRELVALIQRQGRTNELVETLTRVRPQVTWDELVATSEGAAVEWPNWRTRALKASIVAIGVLVLVLVLRWLLEPDQLSTSPTVQAPMPNSTQTLISSSVLFLELWSVEQDVKQDLIATQQFVDLSDKIITEDTLTQIGEWIKGNVGAADNLEAESLQVRVRIPADLSQESPEIEAPQTDLLQIHLWLASDSEKNRIRLSEAGLPNLNEDFFLELSHPGYESQVLKVVLGEQLDQIIHLPPGKITLGIEKVEGAQNTIANQLTDYLAGETYLTIRDPATLESLRQQIEEDEALLAECIECQFEVRRSLGVDFILSGNYEE